MNDPREILERLTEPFALDEIKFKAQTVKGNRAMATAYLDARAVEDRLDEVLGLDWSDEYAVLADGSVACRLTVRLPEGPVTREDVGSTSDQPDAGDRMKAAFSDALKRAAVKFGIGRYLYRLPKQWLDYDPVKKQLLGQAKLPPWALPPKRTAERPAPAATRQPEAVVPVNPDADPEPEAEQGPTVQPAATGDRLATAERILKGLSELGMLWSRDADREWIDIKLDEAKHPFSTRGAKTPGDLADEQADAVLGILKAEFVRRHPKKATAAAAAKAGAK